MSAESRAMEESDERWFRGVDEDDYPPRDEEESETASPSAPSEEIRKLVERVKYCSEMRGKARDADDLVAATNSLWDADDALLSAISRIQAESREARWALENLRRSFYTVEGQANDLRDENESLRAALSETRRLAARGLEGWESQDEVMDALLDIVDDPEIRALASLPSTPKEEPADCQECKMAYYHGPDCSIGRQVAAETGRIPAPVYRAPAAPSEEIRKLVDVQRFAFSMEDGIPGMDERPSGRWVRYEDYASLLSAISRIEAENARLTEGWRRKARELGEAVTQRDSLRAALSEARKDTERLDWLNGKVSWFTQHFAYDHKYATLREAIDDAAFRLGGTDRKEEKP